MVDEALGIKVPEGWNWKPLIECTTDQTISYGIVQPGKQVDDGVPIVRVNNFNNGQLDISNVLKVAPEIEEKFSRTRLQGGEVLLTLVGSTGQSVVAPESLAGWNVPRAIAVIRAEPEIGADWINITLQSHNTQHFLDTRANTTVQKTLNLKDVRQIPVLIPPVKDKAFIESCITGLDRKIELNRQINETLEGMAQALFKSWFVDFDPVIDNALDAGSPIPEELEAKAEQRKKLREAAAKGEVEAPALPDDIRSLFPIEFEFTEEMGWIPKGWKVGSLGDLSQVIGGFAFKSKDFCEKGCPVIKIKNINADRTVNVEDVQYIPDSIAESCKKFQLHNGDVLMAMTGATVGKFGLFVGIGDKPFLLNQRVAKFEALNDQDGSLGFIYCLLNQPNVADFITNTAEGSAQPNISATLIKSVPAICPETKLIMKFNELVNGNFNRMISSISQSKSLTVLRDTLLPKLISGELQIPEAEQRIAKALN